jgi:hypothetical protein
MFLKDCLRAFKQFKGFFRIVYIATPTSRPKRLNKPTLIGNDPPAVTNVPPSHHERTLFGFIRGHSYCSHAGREVRPIVGGAPAAALAALGFTLAVCLCLQRAKARYRVKAVQLQRPKPGY